MNRDHPTFVDAKARIEKLLGDTSIPREDHIEMLEEIGADIDAAIEGIKSDIANAT